MILQKLIECKADLSVVDSQGHTLPMIAAVKCRFMLLKLLIESGVDLEQPNHQGLTLPQLINEYHNITLGEGIAVRGWWQW